MQNKDASVKLPRFLFTEKMHILRSRLFLGFFNSYLKNTGSLEGNWFLKVAIAACLSQYCNNSKKNFSELRKTFFKCMELSGLSFSVKRADLNIGFRLMQLEAESCTASLCYWKICKGIICDTWVMILFYKLCWGRMYLWVSEQDKWYIVSFDLVTFSEVCTCNEITFLWMDCAQRLFFGPSLLCLERYDLK